VQCVGDSGHAAQRFSTVFYAPDCCIMTSTSRPTATMAPFGAVICGARSYSDGQNFVDGNCLAIVASLIALLSKPSQTFHAIRNSALMKDELLRRLHLSLVAVIRNLK